MAKDENKKHYVRVAYAPDGQSALNMIALLEEHGIDSFRQGGVKDIYKVGGDIFGEEIMVDPENLYTAQELLAQMPGSASPPAQKKTSVKKTVLSLLAAAALLVVLLILRGRFFG